MQTLPMNIQETPPCLQAKYKKITPEESCTNFEPSDLFKYIYSDMQHDVPTPVREHIAQVSTEIPHLNPSEMSLDETTRVFKLKKSDRGYQLWQFPKVEINLPEGFCE